MSAVEAPHAAWGKALRTYEALELLQKANEEFGPEFRANEQVQIATITLEKRFGPHDQARKCAEYNDLRAAALTAYDRDSDLANDAYYEPARLAAIALARTPAPDIAAMRIKVAAIRGYALEQYVDGADVFDFVRDDALRIAGDIA